MQRPLTELQDEARFSGKGNDDVRLALELIASIAGFLERIDKTLDFIEDMLNND